VRWCARYSVTMFPAPEDTSTFLGNPSPDAISTDKLIDTTLANGVHFLLLTGLLKRRLEEAGCAIYDLLGFFFSRRPC
jgi:hypothetical protein